MQSIELKLAPAPQETRSHRCAAFAVFADGTAAAEDPLLQQLAAFAGQDHLRQGRFFLLPRSRSDVRASGLFWISRDPASVVQCPAGAIALRPAAPGSGLWIPWFSKLVPEIAPAMLAEIASVSTLVRVWLPSIGLIGFAEDDEIRPADWLVPDDRSPEQGVWSPPPETWSPPGQLMELSMLVPPTPESIFQDIGNEIGLPPKSLLEVDDRGEEEEKTGAGRRAKNWLLKKLDRMAQRSKRSPRQRQQPPGRTQPASPGSGVAGGGGLGSVMGKITAPMAAAMSKMMQGERERQIQKLLNMMSANPDEALKYAIPVSGMNEAFRGFAIPGSQLLSRLTDFSLGGLSGGSGPADFWSINYRLQAQLQEKYRQQANREIAAGRYRRAAYIFAHLLGDLRAAASALRQGKQFAEAAVLYRDKLRDKPSAADCLAEGGFYAEACSLLVSMNQFEAAGKVWLNAGEAEKAREMFECAFEIHLNKGAVVSAATILNDRLDQRDRAIELLRDQWPAGNDASRACEIAVRWMGEDGRHDDTLQWLQRMADTAGEYHRAAFAQLSSQTATTYPDQRVRIAAEDHCRVAVSRSLAESAPIEIDAALSTIANLEPADPQLRRDSVGYRRRLDAARTKSKPPETRPAVRAEQPREMVQLPPIQLPAGPNYFAFGVLPSRLPDGYQLFAVGVDDRGIRVYRMPNCKRSSRLDTTSHAALSGASKNPARKSIKMGPAESSGMFLVVDVYAPIGEEEICSSEQGAALTQMRTKLLGDIVAVAAAPGDEAWELSCDLHSVVLRHKHHQTYDLLDQWVESWEQDAVEIYETREFFELTVVHGAPVISMNAALLTVRRGRVIPLGSCTGVIRDLSPSLPRSRNRVAVAHDAGLDVFYLDTGDSVSVCRERPYTKCVWGGNGKLVAWSDSRLYCFELRGGFIDRIAEMEVRHDGSPVGLLRLEAETVGITWTDGTVTRYRLPR